MNLHTITPGASRVIVSINLFAAVTPASSWDSPVPPGYDTIYGFFHRENPEAFSLLGDPVEDLNEDHADLAGLSADVIAVEAPPALKRIGIQEVAAFPVALLQKHLL